MRYRFVSEQQTEKGFSRSGNSSRPFPLTTTKLILVSRGLAAN